MAKMFFNNPIIILGGGMNEPGETEINIPDSAQGGINSITAPCNYQYWLTYGVDLTGDGVTNEYDYVQWWTNMISSGHTDFTMDVFYELNGSDWSGPIPTQNP